MNTSQRYLQAIERRYGISLGKEVAQLLGVAEMSVSRYRTGQKGFSDDVAMRAADLLELDRDVVLAEIQADRCEPGAARDAWIKLAKRLSLGKSLVAILVGVAVTLASFGVGGGAQLAGANGPFRRR